MRPSLGGLPTRGGGGSNPAIAAAWNPGATDTTAGATPLTATLATAIALDGWTLTGNVLTCLVPGVYRMDMQGRLAQSGANTAALGYRVNGGAFQSAVDLTSAVSFQYVSLVNFVKFAAGDTFEVRLVGSGGSNASLSSLALSLMQVSTFQ